MTEKKETPMTEEAAKRIQSKTAKDNDGKVGKKSFATRAQRANDKNSKK